MCQKRKLNLTVINLCICMYIFGSNTHDTIHEMIHIRICLDTVLTQAPFRESKDCNWTEMYAK